MDGRLAVDLAYAWHMEPEKMDRRIYRCSGCGKIIISGAIPFGWTYLCDSPERYICEQCRADMKTPYLLVTA